MLPLHHRTDGRHGMGPISMRQEKDCAILTPSPRLFSFSALVGGCSSAWLEPQIVDLDVAGSNPVSHPIFFSSRPKTFLPRALSHPLHASRGLAQERLWAGCVLPKTMAGGTEDAGKRGMRRDDPRDHGRARLVASSVSDAPLPAADMLGTIHGMWVCVTRLLRVNWVIFRVWLDTVEGARFSASRG